MNPHNAAPRVLLVIDQFVLVQYVTRTRNRGISHTQGAQTAQETVVAITTWRPHLEQ